MFVKICGLSTSGDVSAAVAAGADALGFVFVASPRQVSVEQALDICRDLPSDRLRVAVMKQPDQAMVDDVLQRFKPDVLQTDSDDIANLSLPRTLTCWPVFRQGVVEPEPDALLLDPLSEDPAAFLYEGAASGSGESIDWAIAAQYTGYGRLVLAGGLDADNVGAAIRRVGPWGVDVSSGVESTRGKKDPEKIHTFVNAARAATRTT